MADLFDRLTNQPIGTATPAPLPSVDFAANREAVRTSQTIANAMDRISNSAFKRAERSQTIAGSLQGSTDPSGTLQGLQGRDLTNLNIQESAAYKTAVEGLSAQVEVEAKQEMGKIYLDAVEKNQTPQELQERLDMAVVGFSDSMSLLDPASAQQLGLKLDSYSGAQFLNFSEDYLKEQRKTNRADAAVKLTLYNENLEDLARTSLPDAVLNERLVEEYETIQTYLKSKDFSEEEIASEILKTRRRVEIAKARGAFERIETVEEKNNFVEQFKKSISSGEGLASAMDDATAESLLNEFERGVKQQKSTLSGEITNLAADIKTEVTSIVQKGSVVSDEKINNFRVLIKDLEEQGADKAEIAELKEKLSVAENNIDYFRSIRDYTIPELQSEQQRLEGLTETGATADDLLRLEKVRRKLTPMIASARAQNSAWESEATDISSSLDDLEKVVERFDSIRNEDLENISTQINALAAAGAPGDLVNELRDDYNTIVAQANDYNDIANDTSAELEDKRAALQSQVGGLSVADSEKLDAIKKRETAQRTALANDPLLWADGAGVVQLSTDLVETIFGGNQQDVTKAVNKRLSDANRVSAHYGETITILTKAEASALSAALIEAPIEEQAFLLGTVVDAFGSSSLKVMGQISKDAPDMAHIGGLIVNGSDQEVINAALKGRIAKDGFTPAAVGESSDKKATVTNELAGIGVGSPAMIGTVSRLTEVANLIYYGRGGSEGGRFDPKAFEQALQDAAGQVIINGEAYGGYIQYKGQAIILPKNIRQDGGVDEVIDNLESIDDLLAISPMTQVPTGAVNDLPITIADIQRRKFRLLSVHDGLYKLVKANGEVVFSGNEPFLIDLKLVGQQQ